MDIYKYPYSEIDNLEFPQKYQMSEYLGTSFLVAYKKSRKEIIDQIKIENKDIVNLINDNSKFSEDEFLKIREKKVFKMENMLWFLYKRISENKFKIEYNELINRFIKKFEITKKIFDFYEHDLSTKSKNFRILRNYLILSLICIKLYEKKMKLKYLNTSLKINDLLCSNFKKISDGFDLRLLKEILQSESKYIENLMNKRGLNITWKLE